MRCALCAGDWKHDASLTFAPVGIAAQGAKSATATGGSGASGSSGDSGGAAVTPTARRRMASTCSGSHRNIPTLFHSAALASIARFHVAPGNAHQDRGFRVILPLAEVGP